MNNAASNDSGFKTICDKFHAEPLSDLELLILAERARDNGGLSSLNRQQRRAMKSAAKRAKR
ncbi:hypothetical protein MRQ47_004461 [Salmonella enterica]|nr:hypothetical protein [Salmonella enterica]